MAVCVSVKQSICVWAIATSLPSPVPVLDGVQRLRITSGKGDHDRVIPMSPKLVQAIQVYLAERETGVTDHLLLHFGEPPNDKLLRRRLRRFGELAGVANVTPHRLRHTIATLLVNQGMPILSLQKFLGHQHINQTLLYARVYDETVYAQFTAAMHEVEAIRVADWPQAHAEIEQPAATSKD